MARGVYRPQVAGAQSALILRSSVEHMAALRSQHLQSRRGVAQGRQRSGAASGARGCGKASCTGSGSVCECDDGSAWHAHATRTRTPDRLVSEVSHWSYYRTMVLSSVVARIIGSRCSRTMLVRCATCSCVSFSDGNGRRDRRQTSGHVESSGARRGRVETRCAHQPRRALAVRLVAHVSRNSYPDA